MGAVCKMPKIEHLHGKESADDVCSGIRVWVDNLLQGVGNSIRSQPVPGILYTDTTSGGYFMNTDNSTTVAYWPVQGVSLGTNKLYTGCPRGTMAIYGTSVGNGNPICMH